MRPSFAPRRARGFTLIEMLCVLAVAAILSTAALPGYHRVIAKARRSDATITLMRLQLAQESYRADHGRYGGPDELRLPARTDAGHYRLAVVAAADDAFEAHAVADGVQAADADCRRMTLRVTAGRALYASGPSERRDNADDANRACWSMW